jgi:hypothetical protein
MPAILCDAQTSAKFLQIRLNLPNARMNFGGFAAFVPQLGRLGLPLQFLGRRLPGRDRMRTQSRFAS